MREAATSTSLLPCHKHSQTLTVRHLKTAEHLKISKMEEDGNKRQIKRREKKVKGIWCSGCWRASQPMTCHQRSFVQSWPLVYPPMGSTAYEREISTPPMLLRSMALLYLYLFSQTHIFRSKLYICIRDFTVSGSRTTTTTTQVFI